MTQSKNQTTADPGAGIEILSTPAELDLTIGDGLVEQGYAAITRSAWLLLLDLTRPVPLRRLRGSAPSSGSPTRPMRQDAVSASSRRGRRSRRYFGSAAWTAGCRCSRPSTTHGRSSLLQPVLRRPDAQIDWKALSGRIGHADVAFTTGLGLVSKSDERAGCALGGGPAAHRRGHAPGPRPCRRDLDVLEPAHGVVALVIAVVLLALPGLIELTGRATLARAAGH